LALKEPPQQKFVVSWLLRILRNLCKGGICLENEAKNPIPEGRKHDNHGKKPVVNHLMNGLEEG
jgi:hypothetical protein